MLAENIIVPTYFNIYKIHIRTPPYWATKYGTFSNDDDINTSREFCYAILTNSKNVAVNSYSAATAAASLLRA